MRRVSRAVTTLIHRSETGDLRAVTNFFLPYRLVFKISETSIALGTVAIFFFGSQTVSKKNHLFYVISETGSFPVAVAICYISETV